MEFSISKSVMGAALFSLIAISVTHFDGLPYSLNKPFLDAVRENTPCGTSTNANVENCIQTRRQIRSLIAAMAAAIFTVAAATTSSKAGTVAYGIGAGVTALKAVYNQMMYITNGDLTLPIIILAVAAILILPLGGALLAKPSKDRDSSKPS